MLGPLVQVSVGLAALVYGGERVVDHASAIAHELGLSTLFIGVTFVAVGSSIPEIATSVYAGLYDAPVLVAGHIIGSATSQITVGIGVVALLSPIAIPRSKLRLYGGGMLAAMGLMLAVLWSGRVTRVEGALLTGAYLTFLGVSYEELDLEAAVDHRASSETSARTVVWLIGGLALVVVGGHLFVAGSRQAALALGVPQLVLGLVTGLGTTTPEIAIAAAAVLDDQAGIAIGTLFGSNVTDPLFSFGVGALVGGFTFTDVGVVLASAAYMLVASTLVVALFLVHGEVDARGALGCIALYLPTFLV
ncbi:MAG: sodium:calcium antiporter [Haloglomus sp.]